MPPAGAHSWSVSRFSVQLPPPGAPIRGRFSQQDLDHGAVVYVIPPEVEVTNDSFHFRLTDPAGNSASPDMWVCPTLFAWRGLLAGF